MASLKFIMDADDQPDRRGIHKTQDPALPVHHSLSRQEPLPSSPAATSTSRQSHVSSPGDVFEPRLPTPALPGGQRTRRGGPSPRDSPSGASHSSFSAPLSSTRPDTAARRQSTSSNESMDQTGYGSAASSSSMRTGGLHRSNTPMRPMRSQPSVGDIPLKLTPITGRVSRAKKGVPVHTCDICKPPKTFTRAEHLRRHQLSHQTPGYPCHYPGCDRAFHRPDLLARHQQRHEQEGDGMSSGSQDDIRPPSLRASSHLPVDGSLGSSMITSVGTTATAPSSSSATRDVPSTPNPSADQRSAYPQLSHSPTAHQVQVGAGSSGYRSPAAGSQDYPGYTLSPRPPTVSVIHPSRGPSSMPGSGYSSVLDAYHQPRTSPPSIYVVTQGLSRASPQISENAPPELYHHDTSPYVSSASDSTYSTPVSDISRGGRFQWVPSRPSPQPEWLSPYPNATSRELSGPGDVMAATAAAPMFVNPFPPTSTHFSATSQPHSFGNMLDVSIGVYPPGETHHPLLSPSSETTYRQHIREHHHPHGSSANSMRSPTPPSHTSSHATDTLVTPAPVPPSRLDGLSGLGRHKDLAIEIAGEHGGLLGIGVLGADLGAGPGSGGGGSFGSHGDLSDGGDGGVSLPALDLPMGGCGVTVPSMAIPLQRSVRASIPGYLDIYWARIHHTFPIVHRRLFETGAEDVLRCAMAAVATQCLDNKEDRNRGNQLHEYAWQEAKRITSWSLQVMQAILLCEHFARFRGRKAVTRPSKLFESLYSRVLYHNPAMFDPAVLGAEQQLGPQERWQAWLDAEARRRLLTACFIVDVHTSVLQQQRRAHECSLNGSGTPPPPIPLSGPSSALWEAMSADQWAAILEANPAAGSPVFVQRAEVLTPADIASYPRFDRAATLAMEILRLPAPTGGEATAPYTQHAAVLVAQSEFDFHGQQALRQFGADPHGGSFVCLEAEARISTLFEGCPMANTYLAMHHTPLHDLLAVSGDSWVFSQKVLPVNSFLEHKKLLKQWAEQPPQQNQPMRTAAHGTLEGISATKAAIYASRALVGFFSRMPLGSMIGDVGGQSSPIGFLGWNEDIGDYWALYVCALICWAFGHRARPANERTHSGSSGDRASTGGLHGATADDEALGWLRLMAEMRVEDVARLRGRREAAGVVGLVRRRLDMDCIGGKSRLYVDAVGVLRKLEEGINWKWF